jgi:hypothetical protein
VTFLRKLGSRVLLGKIDCHDIFDGDGMTEVVSKVIDPAALGDFL